jgi:hypothetical protein
MPHIFRPYHSIMGDRLDEAFFKARGETESSFNTAVAHTVSILALTNRSCY